MKNVSHTLKSYVQRALKWEEEGDLPSSCSNELQVYGLSSGLTSSIVFTSIDVQKINNLSLTSEAPRFLGSALIFLELPQVNNTSSISFTSEATDPLRYNVEYFLSVSL